MQTRLIIAHPNGQSQSEHKGYRFLAIMQSGVDEYVVMGYHAGKDEYATFTGIPGLWAEGGFFKGEADEDGHFGISRARADLLQRSGILAG